MPSFNPWDPETLPVKRVGGTPPDNVGNVVLPTTYVGNGALMTVASLLSTYSASSVFSGMYAASPTSTARWTISCAAVSMA